MIAQKMPECRDAKESAQLLPLSCLLASLPVLAVEQADKGVAQGGRNHGRDRDRHEGRGPHGREPPMPSPWSIAKGWIQHAVLKLDESLRYRSGVLSQSYGSGHGC